MAIRIINIDIDTAIGNKLYWFLREMMEKYPSEIQEWRKKE